MSKSAIYTVNSSTQSLTDGSTINLGSTIRRFGPNLALSGNAIQIEGAGYYDIEVSTNISSADAGEVTVQAYLNNIAIPGAIATETAAAAGDIVNLSISALIREGCYCCNGLSTLTFVISAGAAVDITNFAVVVKKL